MKHEPFDDFTLHLQQERNILSCLSVKSSESVVVKLKHASYHFSWTYNHRKNHFEYFNIDILKVSLQNYRQNVGSKEPFSASCCGNQLKGTPIGRSDGAPDEISLLSASFDKLY